jgi:predicted nuclease of restriction endonuclease-like RecB superfamily
MLTGKMVRVRYVRDRIVPQYLDVRDPQWLDVAEQLLTIFRSSQGRSRGEMEAEIEELFGDLPQPLIHNGLAKLLEDRCDFEVQAGLPPDAVRDAVFLAAAKKRQQTLEEIGQSFSREEVLRGVAESLQAEVQQVEASLFADLKSEERLTQLKDITAERLLERYNVALAQAVLLRSTGVEIVLRGETPQRYRQMFREIKFRRLICDVELISEPEASAKGKRSVANASGSDAYRLRVDGPLSLFSATQKYGLQLALFLPTLLLCKHFELTAKLRWGPERRDKLFLLSHEEGLVSHQAETGAYVPPEATMFVELFRKKIADWELREETEIIPLGKQVWVPDYRLVHRATGNVVLLDILGFWRRSSAERHLAMLKEHAGAPFIVAISDQLNVEDSELEALPDHVVRFRNMPLPDEVAKRADLLNQNHR